MNSLIILLLSVTVVAFFWLLNIARLQYRCFCLCQLTVTLYVTSKKCFHWTNLEAILKRFFQVALFPPAVGNTTRHCRCFSSCWLEPSGLDSNVVDVRWLCEPLLMIGFWQAGRYLCRLHSVRLKKEPLGPLGLWAECQVAGPALITLVVTSLGWQPAGGTIDWKLC